MPISEESSDALVFELLRTAANQFDKQSVLRELTEIARLVRERESADRIEPKHALDFPLGITLRT